MTTPTSNSASSAVPSEEEPEFTFVDGTEYVDAFLADDPEAVAQSAKMLAEMHRADRDAAGGSQESLR